MPRAETVVGVPPNIHGDVGDGDVVMVVVVVVVVVRVFTVVVGVLIKHGWVPCQYVSSKECSYLTFGGRIQEHRVDTTPFACFWICDHAACGESCFELVATVLELLVFVTVDKTFELVGTERR